MMELNLSSEPADALPAATGEDEQMIMNHPHVRLFFLLAYLCVFFCCVVGNLCILVVIWTNRSMRTATNFFLANLAIADLLVGVFCVLQNAVHFVLFEHGTWPFGRVMCHSYIYILHMIPNASAGILVLLSIERFIAVLRPMLVHHLLTPCVLLASAVLVWAFSALMNLPYLVAVQYMEFGAAGRQPHAICTRRALQWAGVDVLKVVTTLNLVVWYAVPLLALLGIYVTIGFVLMRTTEDNAVARSSQNKTSNPKSSPTEGPARKLPRLEPVDSRKRVIRLVVVIVLAFACLSLPRYIYLSWSVFRTKNAPRCLNCLSALIQPTTFLLLFVNSGINPILYAFLSQRFRAAIADMLVCNKAKRKTRLYLKQLRPSRSTPMADGGHTTIYSSAAWTQRAEQEQQQLRLLRGDSDPSATTTPLLPES